MTRAQRRADREFWLAQAKWVGEQMEKGAACSPLCLGSPGLSYSWPRRSQLRAVVGCGKLYEAGVYYPRHLQDNSTRLLVCCLMATLAEAGDLADFEEAE